MARSRARSRRGYAWAPSEGCRARLKTSGRDTPAMQLQIAQTRRARQRKSIAETAKGSGAKELRRASGGAFRTRDLRARGRRASNGRSGPSGANGRERPRHETARRRYRALVLVLNPTRLYQGREVFHVGHDP